MNEQTQTSSERTASAGVAEAARTEDAWALLRVWHLEAMETVIEHPAVCHFVRTSYVSVPTRWHALPLAEVARRVEMLLLAHYRIRAATLWTPEVDERMQPFAFDFEWVARADMPAQPVAEGAPWLFPVAQVNPHLEDLAFEELSARREAARPGIASRCYDDAFAAVRVDVDDTWHMVRHADRAAMFAARHEAP